MWGARFRGQNLWLERFDKSHSLFHPWPRQCYVREHAGNLCITLMEALNVMGWLSTVTVVPAAKFSKAMATLSSVFKSKMSLTLSTH